MRKIIEFIPELSMGGAETLVKDYCLKIDKSKFNVIVLCSIKYGNPWEKVLEEAGIRVVYINDYSEKKPKDFIEKFLIRNRRFNFVKDFFRQENPDVIHIHLGLAEYVYYSKVLCNVFYTVHSTPDFVWRKNKREERYCKYLVKKNNMRFITLHDQMRQEVNKRFKVNNSIVLNNGIDFSKFDIDINVSEIRKSFNIPENAYVIGHIGRFVNEKNHNFLVDVFYEVSKLKQNAFLLLIGDGILKEIIQQKLDLIGLKGKYLILSNRTDIPVLLKMMNMFVFPSILEGLGIVLVEAQKTALPCIVSDTVPKAVVLSNLVTFMSLSNTAKEWAERILTFNIKKIEMNGLEDWDMNNVIHKLEDIYNGNV